MKKIIKYFSTQGLEIVRTRTFRQSAITFSGVMLNGILGVIFYFLTARSLGPASYGIFSVTILTLNLIADIGDIGTDTAIVRFVSNHFDDEREKALRFLKLGFEIKIGVWIVTLILGWLVLPVFAREVLLKPELILPLRISLVGIGGVLLFSFATHAAQALERFWLWSGLNVSMNALRVVFVLLLIAITGYDLWESIWVYILFPFLGFILALFFLPKFLSVKHETKVASEFFKYSKWIGVFTLISAITSRLDTYLSTRYLSLDDVGIYSVAVNLANIVPQVVFALATVVAPKLTKFQTDREAIRYLKKVQIFVVALGIVGVIGGSIIALFVIPLLYGAEFTQSIVPLIVLLAAQALFLISIPAHTAVIYYFTYPKLFVYISIGHMAITLFLGRMLISQFGYIGASYTVLAGNIFNFAVPAIWVLNRFSKGGKR